MVVELEMPLTPRKSEGTIPTTTLLLNIHKHKTIFTQEIESFLKGTCDVKKYLWNQFIVGQTPVEGAADLIVIAEGNAFDDILLGENTDHTLISTTKQEITEILSRMFSPVNKKSRVFCCFGWNYSSEIEKVTVTHADNSSVDWYCASFGPETNQALSFQHWLIRHKVVVPKDLLSLSIQSVRRTACLFMFESAGMKQNEAADLGRNTASCVYVIGATIAFLLSSGMMFYYSYYVWCSFSSAYFDAYITDTQMKASVDVVSGGYYYCVSRYSLNNTVWKECSIGSEPNFRCSANGNFPKSHGGPSCYNMTELTGRTIVYYMTCTPANIAVASAFDIGKICFIVWTVLFSAWFIVAKEKNLWALLVFENWINVFARKWKPPTLNQEDAIPNPILEG